MARPSSSGLSSQWQKGHLEEAVVVVPKGSILEPELFNIFVTVLGSGEGFTLSRSVDGRKWGGVADTLDVCAAIQRNLDRTENWTEDPYELQQRENAKSCLWGVVAAYTSACWGLTSW